MQRTDGWALLAMSLLWSCKSASFAISKLIISLFTFVYTLDDKCNENVRREFLQKTPWEIRNSKKVLGLTWYICLKKLSTQNHWPKIENKTKLVYYCISNCRLNTQAKDKVKLKKVQLALWFVHTNTQYVPLH